jgi:filamentous hemagglutinin family protein
MVHRQVAKVIETLVHRHRLPVGLAALTFICLPAYAQTLPTGGAFTAGSGGIATSGATTTITQSGARGIITWQSFSIGAGGKVQFNNGSGATLNRVTGGSLSQIEGQLGATGSVYLINPSGVVIGPGGAVVTGGSFVASTRDVSDDSFMIGGPLTFAGTGAGGVSNAGSIVAQGGDVVLIGAMASNTGTMAARNGTAALASGNQVVLSAASGPAGVYVVPDTSATGNVSNSGRIRAAAAELASAGGNVYALAGNRGGLIQATGAKTIAGQVWLTAPNGTVEVGGTVTARNADRSGGTIIANGQQVAIDGTALLSASGTARLSTSGTRGGTVLVGVSAPGGVNQARSTTIASGARITATGRGGGGRIETSGQTLVLGKATVNAGPGGTWLLDPTDLAVDAAAASTIDTSLNGGTDVTLQTTASGASGPGNQTAGPGDITIAAPLGWGTGATLTLSAFNGINIDAAITISGAGGLVLTTNNNVGGASTGNGALSFTGGNVSYTGAGGSLTINGTPYTLVSDLATLGADISANPSGSYALATSIDVSGTPYTTEPVTTTFTGTFEGLGNTISNLTINSSDFQVGLFAEIGAGGVVRDLGLAGGSVAGTSLLAEVGELVGENFGTVANSYATGSVSGTSSAGIGIYVGGLVGFNSQGTISNDYATGAVTSNATGNNGGFAIWAGGLVGYSFHGTITGSYATGTVNSEITGTSSITAGSLIQVFAGGLLGFGYGTTVSNSHAIGPVTGSIPGSISSNGNVNIYATGTANASITGSVSSASTSSFVGGLIGDNNTSTLSTSYATGAATGGAGSYVGGLAGGSQDGTIANAYATGAATGGIGSTVGALVGFSNDNSSVSTSYAIGVPSGGAGSLVAGLIGSDDGTGTFTSLFWDTTTSGTMTGIGSGSTTGLTGLTTLQWLTLGPIATSVFDTTSTWVTGYPYPVLQALPYVLVTASGTQVYGAASPGISIATILDQNGNNASGLVNSAGVSWLTTATAASNVGSASIIGGQGATVSPGYQLTYIGTVGVTPAILTYVATPTSRIYGTANPTFTGTITGFVNGQNVATATTGTPTFTTTATPTSSVGTYPIDGSGLTANFGNYVFTQAAANDTALTIDPVPPQMAKAVAPIPPPLPVPGGLPQPTPWDGTDWLRLLPGSGFGPLPEIITVSNIAGISRVADGYDLSTGLSVLLQPEETLYQTGRDRHPMIRLPPSALPSHLQGGF